MREKFSLLLTLFILLTFAAYAQAVPRIETITDFDSHITVNKDASIDVTEKITVYAKQQAIRRGIMRQLPTRYTDSYGVLHHTRYRVKEIEVNGITSPYFTRSENDMLSIFIGDKDVLLVAGFYTYTIEYHVDEAINFLSDGDELYWNITGNGWRFPIHKASATIQLPEGATILNYSGYTGFSGQKEQAFSVTKPYSNQIIFTTTSALPSGSGLTVAVAWPKGIVIEPTWLDRLKAQILPTPAEFTALGIALLALLYFSRTWRQHGKDPIAGTIIPLFEPPLNFSPAAVRYISSMRYDNKTFTTAIVSLATKGALLIQNVSGSITLKSKNNPTATLTTEENSVASALFAKGNSLLLAQSNSGTIQKAERDLSASLRKTFGNQYFVTNRGYFFKGALISLLSVIILTLGANDTAQTFFALVWLSIWSFVCLFLMKQAWEALMRAFSSVRNFFRAIRAITSSLFLIPFLIGEVVGIYIFMDSVKPITLILIILITIMNMVFLILLKAPTPEGRKLMDQIAGFRLFLSTTERYRLNQLNPPQKTPELFEKFLPYAIALNVENEWGEQFNELLKTAGTEAETYHPSWYIGPAFAPTVFPSFLNDSLSGAISSASVSTSSSASGGGGSSGGGGGGGGGGGW